MKKKILKHSESFFIYIMKIYDGFCFFNELNTLEVRLNVLYDVVDYFIVSESNRTHSGKPKPSYFLENQERFKPYRDKIIHIFDTDPPGFFKKFRVPGRHDFENHQRHQIVQGLKNCEKEDRVIISDLDEIPSKESIEIAKGLDEVVVFEHYWSNFFFNNIAVSGPETTATVNKDGFLLWRGSVMTPFKEFDNPKQARLRRGHSHRKAIPFAGWHFSFLGGLDVIRHKLKNWCHYWEDKYTPDFINDDDKINEIIDSGKDLFDEGVTFKIMDLNEGIFPQYLVENKTKYAESIRVK